MGNSIGTVFKGNGVIQRFTELEFFTSIETMNKQEFNSCSLLSEVHLPRNLKYSENALVGSCTSLKRIIIYDSILDMQSLGSTSRTDAVCVINAIVPPLINGYGNNGWIFYVPDDSVSAYKTATNWSAYASRIFSLTQFAIDFPNG